MRCGTPLLISLVCASAWAKPTKGPYLQDVEQTAVTVSFQSEGGGTVRLIGPNGDDLLVENTPAATGVHEVRLQGLQADNAYRYSVEGPGFDPSEGSFSTATSADEPFTFVVYGDNRSDHGQHAQVVAAIVPEAPDFLINTGDLVADGDSEEDWQTFFDIEHSLLLHAPIYPAVGNHEAGPSGAQLYGKYFAPPTASSDKEEYYAFTYGNTRFIVLDTHVFAIAGGPDLGQTAWLDRELARQDARVRHKFLVMHHGPYSSMTGRTGNLGLQYFWMDKFRDAGIDMILSGHDHYYERGQDARGLRYAIVGAGGAPLYPTIGPGERDDRSVYVSQSVLSFVVFTVTGGHVEGCAKDVNGNTLECFSWGASAEPAADPRCRVGADCDPALAGACPGAFDCLQGQCLWVCARAEEPADVECLSHGDCVNRAIPADCHAGNWRCDSNQQCRLLCNQEPAPDAPTPGPEAGETCWGAEDCAAEAMIRCGERAVRARCNAGRCDIECGAGPNDFERNGPVGPSAPPPQTQGDNGWGCGPAPASWVWPPIGSRR